MSQKTDYFMCFMWKASLDNIQTDLPIMPITGIFSVKKTIKTVGNMLGDVLLF